MCYNPGPILKSGRGGERKEREVGREERGGDWM